MDDLNVEYEIIEMLAEKRWKLIHQLKEVEAMLKHNSGRYFVGEDGLVEESLI